MAGELDYTRANFMTLQEAEADFSMAFRALRDELDDLDRELRGLLAPWIGDAALNYEGTQREWNSAANDMSNVLRALGLAIGDVHHNYASAEKANADLWAGGTGV